MEPEPNIFDPKFCPPEVLQEILQEIESEDDDTPIVCNHSRVNETLFTAGATTAAAGAAGVGVPVAATAGLTAAGFTSSGIAAGSTAAAAQSAIGSVAAGSTFATLQSIGATGGFAILGPLGIGAAALAGGGALLYRRRQNQLREERIQQGTAVLFEDLCKRCWIKMKLKITRRPNPSNGSGSMKAK